MDGPRHAILRNDRPAHPFNDQYSAVHVAGSAELTLR
jgi:hypothetical protein